MLELCRNLIGVIAIILCVSALAAYGAFEDVGMGARPLGMGSAFVANADGAEAVFWNPAGIARLDERELTMSYVELYGLVSYNSLSYAQRMKIGSIGFGLVSSSDVDGVYRETTLALSAAREFYSNLSAGTNIRYLSSAANTGDIEIGGGKGLALDMGCQYRAYMDMLFLGVSFQNLISYVSYNRNAIKDIPGKKYSERPDFSYKIGAGVDLRCLSHRARNTILAAEFSDGHVHIGTEYTLRDVVAVRAGFKMGNALTSSITAGFGLKLSAFSLDYAYVGSGIGAQTSQFSLSVDW